MIKSTIKKTRTLLTEYSPVALLILTAPFFLPIDRHLHRSLLIFGCAFPAMLLTVLNPAAIFKKPVLLSTILFVAYFSIQDFREMIPITLSSIRQVGTLGAMILFPVIMLSFATPNRKLYPVAIRLILFVAVIGSIYSLISFYSKVPFPTSRLEFATSVGYIPNSNTGSAVTSVAALMAAAFFLQSGPRLTRWDWFSLACLPILLAVTFYSHSRGSALGVLLAMASLVLGIQTRLKKTLLLFAMTAATLILYSASLKLPPQRLEIGNTLPSTPALSETIEHSTTSSKKQAIPKGIGRLDKRSGGFINPGAGGRVAAGQRLETWHEYLSNMDPVHWITGCGLGRKSTAGLTQKHPHPHNMFIWATYHGGAIGLGLLLALLGTAGWTALRAGVNGYIPRTLLVSAVIILGLTGEKLRVGVNHMEYLVFWIPIALAAGLPRKSKEQESAPEET